MLEDSRELVFFLVNAVLKMLVVPLTLLYTVLVYGLFGFAVYCGVCGLVLWAVTRLKGGDW
jgi:uncharacterized membrane protein YvlD (DUF360 family)